MKHQVFASSDTNVHKFIFEEEGDRPIAIEAVLYKYPSYVDRTVICCSTQCGCPVGCTFCGTGKFFVRNLEANEIIEQVDTVIAYTQCPPNRMKRLQIMFMSMGEPFLNFHNLKQAIIILHRKYPNADLLVSTSAPARYTLSHFDSFIALSKEIDKVGIQFSVHESNDTNREKLIPTNTCKLSQIGELGERWAAEVGRKPFFNYCVHGGNASEKNVQELLQKFNPDIWESTLSVICEKDNTIQNSINTQLDLINRFSRFMVNAGYSVRIFNPAGQDDIGGGCGQLWYFQEWRDKQARMNKATY